MKDIKAIIGVYKDKGPKGGTTAVQSILFPIKYLYSQIKTWLSEHGFKYGSIEESKSYWRARQIDPNRFIRLRTISLNPKPKQKIDTHKWSWDSNVYKKKYVTEAKRELQKQGYKVKIVESKDPGGNIIYELWVSSKKKKNPGTAWHQGKEDYYEKLIGSAKNEKGSAYFEGKRDAHRHSKEVSQALKINPRRKSKWYIGIIGFKGEVKYAELFTSAIIPTTESHGYKYKYAIGPYNSRKEVTQIANYQNFKLKSYKDNPVQLQIVDKIYDKILSIEAQKGKDSLWPNENFRHDFKSGGGIFGLQDGSLLIKSQNGKKLWKRINYE